MNPRQHRVILPLCSLVLAASLASCAPTVQGPTGLTYQPQSRSGAGMLTVQRVAVADLTDMTPTSAFVSFPDCRNTVVALTDVRQLGIEKARDYCKRTDAALVDGIKGVATGFGIFAAVSLILSIVLVFIIDSIIKSF